MVARTNNGKKLKIIAKLISESKELNLAGILGSTML
jgi:hypothetical protein